MKTTSTGFLILGVAFALCSLIWFFWNTNIAMGAVWLLIGMLELLIGAILRIKEKKKK